MENDNKKRFVWSVEYTKVFMNISAWIIGPIIASLFIGKYLDGKFKTSPYILLTCLVISFTVSMIAIVKIAKKYDTEVLKEKDDNK